MMQECFRGSFTQQEPIPEAGIAAALAVLRHGRLHRYNTAPGEIAEAALLEEEFAALVGAKYSTPVARPAASVRTRATWARVTSVHLPVVRARGRSVLCEPLRASVGQAKPMH